MLPRRLPLALLIVALGSCAAPRAPAPAPQPVVRAPTPVATAQPLGTDWRDWPATPGDWRYVPTASGSAAQFGPAGAAPLLTLSCDRTRRTVRLAKSGMGAGAAQGVTVRTSTTLRALPTQVDAGGNAAAELPANDQLLDAMGFSRGRFVVQAAGAPPLVVPAWAEVLRVTEDCRG